MSLRAWLLRPLARFWNRTSPASPTSPTSSGGCSRVARRITPKQPTRLQAPDRLEARETPDDVLGLVTNGLGLGGLATVLPALLNAVSLWQPAVQTPPATSTSGKGLPYPSEIDSEAWLDRLAASLQSLPAGNTILNSTYHGTFGDDLGLSLSVDSTGWRCPHWWLHGFRQSARGQA
jgi:hypothetical protein